MKAREKCKPPDTMLVIADLNAKWTRERVEEIVEHSDWESGMREERDEQSAAWKMKRWSGIHGLTAPRRTWTWMSPYE